MSLRRSNKKGGSLIEVVLAIAIACMAASGALSLLSAVNDHTVRSRLDGRVGIQVRSLQEWMMAMPYMDLVTMVRWNGGSGTFSKEGNLTEGTSLETASGGYRWKLDVRLERRNHDTPDELTTVSPTFTWQEPSLGYPRSTNQSRSLTCPSFQRRRF